MKFSEIRTGRWLTVLLAAAMITSAALLWQVALGQDNAKDDDPQAVAQAKGLSRAFRAASSKVIPTVVKIKTSSKRRVGGQRFHGENPFKGTPFEDFFDENTPGHRFHPPIPQQGIGSGVIIDRTGIILTNNHVIAGADEVLIELANGEQLKAIDIKTDERTDLAVLRVEAGRPLPAARLGDSDSMEIGDWVLAIGCPFELDLTVSAGIISGKGRSLRAGKRASFLQTDAAINPGNSGGPLVNLDGDVVGINTAIASSTGGYQGVGFAIPINLAKWVTKQLIDSGSVRRAYLGVQIREIDSQLAEKLGVQHNQGVAVKTVVPDSPAAGAGIEADDVILSFAGKPVSDPRGLQTIVERSPIGSTQNLEIIRNGEKMTLKVDVKALPEDSELARRTPWRDGFSSDELGLDVDELTEELARRLGYEEATGVLITGVAKDGMAAQAGIREGMLILKVGNQQVDSVAQFKEAIKNESLEEGVLLLIRATDGNKFIVLQRS